MYAVHTELLSSCVQVLSSSSAESITPARRALMRRVLMQPLRDLSTAVARCVSTVDPQGAHLPGGNWRRVTSPGPKKQQVCYTPTTLYSLTLIVSSK